MSGLAFGSLFKSTDIKSNQVVRHVNGLSAANVEDLLRQGSC